MAKQKPAKRAGKLNLGYPRPGGAVSRLTSGWGGLGPLECWEFER